MGGKKQWGQYNRLVRYQFSKTFRFVPSPSIFVVDGRERFFVSKSISR